jgi:ankyrin repeat protein
MTLDAQTDDKEAWLNRSLRYACIMQDARMAQLLMEKGADYGAVPDHIKANYGLTLDSKIEDDPNCKARWLDKALVNACDVSDARMAQLLLDQGADPNTGDGHCLYTCAVSGDVDMLRILLPYGISPTCKLFESSVFAAKSKGYTDFLQLLQQNVTMTS